MAVITPFVEPYATLARPGKRITAHLLTLGARLQLFMDSQVEHTTNCASRGAMSHCRQPPQHTYFTPFSGGLVASLSMQYNTKQAG